MIGWYLVGALGLALLMVIHEAGHFFAARAFGMRVTKFSIGFGPTFFKIVPEGGRYWLTAAGGRIKIRLFRHDPERHGPTIYQVAMIPFLAYVQIAGMNPLDEVSPDDRSSYANASLLGRVVTIFGGPLANYLFASVLFFCSFFFGGRLLWPTAVSVLEGRPASSEAHLQDGDRIVEVNGTPVTEWEPMAAIIASHPGVTMPLVVERDGQRIETHVTPADEGGRGKIGVAMRGPPTKVPVTAKEAAVMALEKPPQVVRDLVVGLGQMLSGKVEGELAGPVGIVKQTAAVAQSGWSNLLELLGILSAYLGAFNLIPFPALDGGRLMFLGYEATTRRRPNARIEAHIHAIGLVMMIGLMLYVTVVHDLGVGGGAK